MSNDSLCVSLEEQKTILETALTRQSLHREILYKTLALCREQMLLFDLEEAMASLPEFSQATQSQYHLISVLVNAGGLERILLDATGAALDSEQLKDLDEDAQDDLVANEAFQTTPLGLEVVALHAPHERLVELMAAEPDRAATYRELLAFCAEESRTYSEIQNLLDGREVLVRTLPGQSDVMQPSVLVDKLQRAAGLVWKDGWNTTEEGKEFLQ